MARMKAAVIGCGRMGAALCDVDEATVNAHGRSYGIRDVFTDYRRLLETVRPGIVTIATRTPGKCDIVKAAIEHGVKGIYVEKPLANSLAACREVLLRATEHRVKLAYGVNRRYHAVYRQARQMVRDGAIGDLVEIGVDHGSGQLLWAHPHAVDLILFFAGTTAVATVSAALDPDSVQIATPMLIDSDPIVEQAAFTFSNRLTACITRAAGLSVRLAGTTGYLTVHADGSWLQLARNDGRKTGYFLETERIVPVAEPSATVTALTELVHAVRTNGEPPISPSEIETGTAMLFGCVVSHLRNGQKVALAEIPAALTVSGRSGARYA
jgi:scyllo-inositol 2-dehydrogenase (NAD+)